MQIIRSLEQTVLSLFLFPSYSTFGLLLGRARSFRTLPFRFSLMSKSASTATGALRERVDLQGVSDNDAKAL